MISHAKDIMVSHFLIMYGAIHQIPDKRSRSFDTKRSKECPCKLLAFLHSIHDIKRTEISRRKYRQPSLDLDRTLTIQNRFSIYTIRNAVSS